MMIYRNMGRTGVVEMNAFRMDERGLFSINQSTLITDDIQQWVQADSVVMIIEAVQSTVSCLLVMVEKAEWELAAENKQRVLNKMGELRRYVSFEVGGALAEELVELCFSIENYIEQAVAEKRGMPVNMAINLLQQLNWIWKAGIEQQACVDGDNRQNRMARHPISDPYINQNTQMATIH